MGYNHAALVLHLRVYVWMGLHPETGRHPLRDLQPFVVFFIKVVCTRLRAVWCTTKAPWHDMMMFVVFEEPIFHRRVAKCKQAKWKFVHHDIVELIVDRDHPVFLHDLIPESHIKGCIRPNATENEQLQIHILTIRDG